MKIANIYLCSQKSYIRSIDKYGVIYTHIYLMPKRWQTRIKVQGFVFYIDKILHGFKNSILNTSI